MLFDFLFQKLVAAPFPPAIKRFLLWGFVMTLMRGKRFLSVGGMYDSYRFDGEGFPLPSRWQDVKTAYLAAEKACGEGMGIDGLVIDMADMLLRLGYLELSETNPWLPTSYTRNIRIDRYRDNYFPEYSRRLGLGF